MNWYKQAKFSDIDWGSFMKWFGISVVSGYVGLIGLDFIQLKEQYKENPQKVINDIQQKIPEIKRSLKPNQIQQKVPNKIHNQNIIQNPVSIDLNKILQIESSGGKDNWNKRTRARGPFQFLEKTWNDCIKKMGKNWDWWNDSMDLEKSRQVADFYYNKEIPRLLKHYEIPDTIETRIGAYSWGIGYLKMGWEKYQNDLIGNFPQETKDYIEKYKGKIDYNVLRMQ